MKENNVLYGEMIMLLLAYIIETQKYIQILYLRRVNNDKKLPIQSKQAASPYRRMPIDLYF